MKLISVLGAILIIGGVIGLAFNVIPIHHQEEVAKIGSLTATQDKENDVFIPPYAAVIAIVAGGILLIAGRRPG